MVKSSGEFHMVSTSPSAATPEWLKLSELKTSQSSTGHGGDSSRAVDGSIETAWSSGSCTHTNEEKAAWWKVDLGEAYAIDKVEVTNRGDCCENRLDKVKVLVDGKECGKGPDKVSKGQTFDVDCKAKGKAVQ